MKKSLLMVIGVLCFIDLALGLDPYDVMSDFLDPSQHPRVLNTLDLPNWDNQNPQPLFTPEADFNQDGNPDIAISGVYDLKSSERRYFLLVATISSDRSKKKKLFYQDYDAPVFIHLPGTTGEGDPGDQAFSISTCWECEKGNDFYWNKTSQKFEIKPWTRRVKHEKKMVEVKVENPPDAVVDESLKIAGAVPEVQKFVKDLKAKNGELGTRVEYDPKDKTHKSTIVSIFEKKEGKEIQFDRMRVDLEKKKVVKRFLKAPDTSR